MVDVASANEAQLAAWSQSWQDRVRQWYGGLGVLPSGERLFAIWANAQERYLGVVSDAGSTVGYVAARLPPPQDGEQPAPAVLDIWIEPAARGKGYGRAARDAAVAWMRPRGNEMKVLLWGADPGVDRLFADYPVRNQRMAKRIEHAPPLPAGVTARPMLAEEYLPWRELEIVEYANDMANSGSLPPDEAARASAKAYDEMLPDGLATPGYEWAVIEAEGVAVATVWLSHREGPDFSFVFGVETQPEHRGRGYGRAAMLAGEAMTARAENGYLSLNVFGHNAVAIGLYTSLGYAVVEQVRALAAD